MFLCTIFFKLDIIIVFRHTLCHQEEALMKQNSKPIKTINTSDLKKKVYVIRNVQVMLDFDLADIYGYEVRALNQQVKRNIARFPEDFMFQLTKRDIDFIKSQFVILPNV
jgi:hypothetical protein